MLIDFRGAAAVGALLIAISCAGTALAQKAGGVLKMYDPDSPASMSIHEEATIVAERPMMGVFNNLVMFDQHVPQNSLALDRARSGHQLVVERGRDRADISAAPGRQMARRQAVHRQGRQMHLGHADRQVEPRSCASIPARPGTGTSRRSPPTAITRSPFI